MTELYKDRFFARHSLDAMMTALSKHYPELDVDRFNELIHDSEWMNREIK